MDARSRSVPDGPVVRIDSLLDAILQRPGMFGAMTPQGLESVVLALLGLRATWRPLGDKRVVPWKTVYGRWIAEYFGDTDPNNLCAAGRLQAKFGWKFGDSGYDAGKAEDWARIVAFYVELVRREREEADEHARFLRAEADRAPVVAGPKRHEYEPRGIGQTLAYVLEECGETVAAGGKSLRWGYASSNPELPEDERETNAAWLRREIADLLAALDRVRQAIVSSDPEIAEWKARSTTASVLLLARKDENLLHRRTRSQRLTWLMEQCGYMIAFIGQINCDDPAQWHDGGLGIFIRRVGDLQLAAVLVQHDIAEHPSDPRDARETLFGPYADTQEQAPR